MKTSEGPAQGRIRIHWKENVMHLVKVDPRLLK
ncbi:hypothetical protein N182_30535 [Sinorhizobium sp. GL2]|nr:hypothetical protein N182_30535 [Sinorhizobium sp. GL2]